jgi:hypothetical protein
MEAPPPPPPDSWETADLDEPMSRLHLPSARRVSSSPDLADADADDPQHPSSGRPDSVDQLDQFLREALEKPRERLSGIIFESPSPLLHPPLLRIIGLATLFLQAVTSRT